MTLLTDADTSKASPLTGSFGTHLSLQQSLYLFLAFLLGFGDNGSSPLLMGWEPWDDGRGDLTILPFVLGQGFREYKGPSEAQPPA